MPTKEEETYKKLKEAFVSNHTGGTINEINLVTAVAPVAYILFAALQTRHRAFASAGLPPLVLDFFLSSLLILLSTTLYAHQPLLLNILIASPAILILLTSPKPKLKPHKLPPKITSDVPPTTASTTSPNSLPKKPFLTVYRGSMLSITCAAILAVDFRVFPRRFAKVENWGTSLMDLGVGSFVFSAGLVGARPILKTSLPPFVARLRTAVRHSVPLLVLGFVRLAMVKGVDYAEHVTEYGVHWNFFFTLGLLPPFVGLLQSLIPSSSRISPTTAYTTLSVLVAGAFQVVLSNTGVQEYVLIGDRKEWGLLGANKEGAASFAGYLSIFLAGMATGGYTLPREVGSSGNTLKTLVAWAFIWTAACVAVNNFHGLGVPISRRLANLPYVLWINAFNTAQLAAFYLVEGAFFGKTTKTMEKEEEEREYKFAVPPVLEALNANGLTVFLVANLLTGLVNVSMKTLTMGRVESMGVLTAYMATIVAAAVGMERWGIRVKL